MKSSHKLSLAVALALGLAACGQKEEPKKAAEPAKPAAPAAGAQLRPGQPVDVTIHKAGGQTVTIQCAQTLTDEQIGWFRAGSALNALK